MFKRLLHGLARAFTVPRAIRQKIDRNPLLAAEKAVLESDLARAISQAVDKNIPNSDLGAAVKAEIGLLLEHTGILK